MQMVSLEQIEAVMDARVRPAMADHGGNLEIAGYEDGVLKVRLLGACSGCPSAYLTSEQLIEKELREALPEIDRVVVETGVSEDLLSFARTFLSGRTAPGQGA